MTLFKARLAFAVQIGIPLFVRMTSSFDNAQAMIIGMIIIRRRLGHGHVA